MIGFLSFVISAFGYVVEMALAAFFVLTVIFTASRLGMKAAEKVSKPWE